MTKAGERIIIALLTEKVIHSLSFSPSPPPTIFLALSPCWIERSTFSKFSSSYIQQTSIPIKSIGGREEAKSGLGKGKEENPHFFLAFDAHFRTAARCLREISLQLLVVHICSSSSSGAQVRKEKGMSMQQKKKKKEWKRPSLFFLPCMLHPPKLWKKKPKAPLGSSFLSFHVFASTPPPPPPPHTLTHRGWLALLTGENSNRTCCFFPHSLYSQEEKDVYYPILRSYGRTDGQTDTHPPIAWHGKAAIRGGVVASLKATLSLSRSLTQTSLAETGAFSSASKLQSRYEERRAVALCSFQ